MNWYAQRPGRATKQISSDVFVLVWSVLWIIAGQAMFSVISSLAEPVREIGRRSADAGKSLRDAGGQAGEVPGVGDGLRRPFDDAAGSIDGIATAAQQQAAIIETAATVTGILTALIPIAVVLAFWLPRRLRFWRTSRAVSPMLDTEAGVDLLALRAMATTPLPVLRKISDDPVRAWRDGDLPVIVALADLEIRRLGLKQRSSVPNPTRSADWK